MKPVLLIACLLTALSRVVAAQTHRNEPRLANEAPLKIVRESTPGEEENIQLHAGDEVVFVVRQQGRPVPQARVRLVTRQGWSRDTLTDDQGRARFQLIRDYFPAWPDFKKRYKSTFLVSAAPPASPGDDVSRRDATVDSEATLVGGYYPAPDDYSSYTWGLAIGLLVTGGGGTTVYLFRRRRVKPYQEVTFS